MNKTMNWKRPKQNEIPSGDLLCLSKQYMHVGSLYFDEYEECWVCESEYQSLFDVEWYCTEKDVFDSKPKETTSTDGKCTKVPPIEDEINCQK